jgi:replication factor C small subunit
VANFRDKPLTMEDLRPASFEEMVGQEEVVARLKTLAEGVGRRTIVPTHLLFHGPPGVGKTTAARAFGHLVLGEDYENSFHHLGSYDERGVNRVRQGIIPLSRRPPSRSAPFRILFLDDADSLVPKAQDALRPALENESGSTVFILACNNLRRIARPIQSRCTVLGFAPLGPEQMHQLVEQLASATDLRLDEQSISAMVEKAHGIPREVAKMLIEAQASAPPKATV